MTILSFQELLNQSKENGLEIFEIAQNEEAKFLEIDIEDVRKKTLENLNAMRTAITNGLKSTEKSVSGWCGDDAVRINENNKEKA